MTFPFDYEQLILQPFTVNFDESLGIKNKRLGKLVEEYVFYHLKQSKSITWLAENLQIQNIKLTVGELDALFYTNETPVHLEID